MEQKYCGECNSEMVPYGNPQEDFWVCSECNGDNNGCEVEWCECGEPFTCGDAKRCDCEDD